MSDDTHIVTFNRNTLRLEMKFDGDDYETASVRFKLEASNGRPQLEEDVTIPVKCLFAMGYLTLMSIRRTAVQYEKEAQEMIDQIKMKKHPFESIGEKKNVKKD